MNNEKENKDLRECKKSKEKTNDIYTEEVKMTTWLANILGCNEKDITKLYNNKFALDFLLMWSLFESKCFSGFLSTNQIEEKEIKLEKCNIDLLNKHFIYFHNRYRNSSKYYHNLKHGTKELVFINELLDKENSDIDTLSKAKFLIYVVYRYRNNMFHGNKGIESWIGFKEEIIRCVEIMSKLFDDLVKDNNEENETKNYIAKTGK